MKTTVFLSLLILLSLATTRTMVSAQMPDMSSMMDTLNTIIGTIDLLKTMLFPAQSSSSGPTKKKRLVMRRGNQKYLLQRNVGK